ncbi:MAG: PepSY domain-containing protein [Gaiellaceae bacterium]
MNETTRKRFLPRSVAVGAIALGLVGGSYGIASAATSSRAATTTGTASVLPTATPPSAGQPWGPQRTDETPLTGDALAKVTALATAKVPGGTIVRVETDADGHAAYEAHMVNASGAPVTVYVDSGFNVVGVETR